MFYLVCRADQLPKNLHEHTKPVDFSGSTSYYPRVVQADSPSDAIDRAFYPDPYKPAGRRKLMVVELGRFHSFTAEPKKEYDLTYDGVMVNLEPNLPF